MMWGAMSFPSTEYKPFLDWVAAGCVPGDGMHVHHRDGNGLNNDLDNLVVLTPSQHSDLHPEGRYGTR